MNRKQQKKFEKSKKKYIKLKYKKINTKSSMKRKKYYYVSVKI